MVRQKVVRGKKPFAQFHKVKHEALLMDYLQEIFQGKSRNSIKSWLVHRQVSVNGTCVTAHDCKLAAGDEIKISAVGEEKPNPNQKCRIVYEDNDIIVIEKREGVLSMSTGVSTEMTAYSMMNAHVAKFKRDARVFIVHRLDRSTSGLMMFAKSEAVQEHLRTMWNSIVLERAYVAVVEGCVEKDHGTVKSYLTEDPKTFRMYSSPTDNGGKLAVTHYKVLKRGEHFSLVQLDLETGRKNQIRVQMSSIGHPIAGDKRYGAKTNPLQRVCLHARSLVFQHPSTGEVMNFQTEIPKAFL